MYREFRPVIGEVKWQMRQGMHAREKFVCNLQGDPSARGLGYVDISSVSELSPINRYISNVVKFVKFQQSFLHFNLDKCVIFIIKPAVGVLHLKHKTKTVWIVVCLIYMLCM